MLPAAIILALAASVTCADIKIVWQLEKQTEQTALTVLEGSKVVAQKCSNLIPGQPHALDFSSVDANGAGNFTVGDSKYLVHYDPAYSGGPVCSRKFNDKVAVIECDGVTWTPSPDVAIEQDCHDDEDTIASVEFLTSTDRVRVHAVPQPQGLVPVKREASPLPPDCHSISGTSLVGDGNPHQNYWDKQMSENLRCASQGCTVSYSVGHSYSVGWSADISPVSWISGGFAVEQSYETGQDYQCPGGPGDTVCVWHNTAHTAYTVHNWDKNTCETNRYYGNPFVMYSPNRANRGGGFYCVIGTCRAIGDAYWDKNGRAGGP